MTVTLSLRRSMGKRALELLKLENDRDYPVSTRPSTRGACSLVPRPCPYVSCRFSLYLDVTFAGSLSLAFPDREPHEMPPEGSCALDVADQGPASGVVVGELLNVTRERVRQLEEQAIEKLGERVPELREYGGESEPRASAFAEAMEVG